MVPVQGSELLPVNIKTSFAQTGEFEVADKSALGSKVTVAQAKLETQPSNDSMEQQMVPDCVSGIQIVSFVLVWPLVCVPFGKKQV